MSGVFTEADLEELFEEVWVLTEMVAGTADGHLFPQLLQLAHEVVESRNSLRQREAASD